MEALVSDKKTAKKMSKDTITTILGVLITFLLTICIKMLSDVEAVVDSYSSVISPSQVRTHISIINGLQTDVSEIKAIAKFAPVVREFESRITSLEEKF